MRPTRTTVSISKELRDKIELLKIHKNQSCNDVIEKIVTDIITE